MRLLFILDPLPSLQLDGDSTYALLLEATRRGHECWTCQVEHLSLEHEDPVAEACTTRARLAATPAEAFLVGARQPLPLDAFDAVLMRTDPPVDEVYLQATWILERARGKTLLVNDPRGLRELNEHLSILSFPEHIPPTVVTRSQARLRHFLEEQGGSIVVKPVEGYGGRGIFLVRSGDPNTSSLLETATDYGKRWTMAQRYLPEATAGDKRILLLEGEILGAILRVPPPGEARDNLHVGAKAQRTEVTEAERALVLAMAPFLAQYGVLFAGIDVIGERLTEINLTSPTGLRHLDALEGVNSAGPILDRIERRAAEL
jgi:glutathione synthase